MPYRPASVNMTHCLIGRFMSGGLSWPGRVERAAGAARLG